MITGGKLPLGTTFKRPLTLQNFIIDIGRCGGSANETTLHPNNNLKKVNHYRSMYGHQHGALAHTEQQAIKGPKITSVKLFKRESQRSNLFK